MNLSKQQNSKRNSSFFCDIKSLKMFKDIYCNVVLDNTIVLGNLQKCAWLVTPIKPLWNGPMKASHDGLCPNKTAIHFEPMTDMPVIVLVSTQPCRHDPVLTFNQSLDWKVMEIITEKQPKGSFYKMDSIFNLCRYSIFTGANLC